MFYLLYMKLFSIYYMDFIKDSTACFISQDEKLLYWPKCPLQSDLCNVMVLTLVLQVRAFQGE